MFEFGLHSCCAPGHLAEALWQSPSGLELGPQQGTHLHVFRGVAPTPAIPLVTHSGAIQTGPTAQWYDSFVSWFQSLARRFGLGHSRISTRPDAEIAEALARLVLREYQTFQPLLLGRGVKAPMLVIFLGAIGGFIASGIIGLFVGAVVLVFAYELFTVWLDGPGELEAAADSSPATATVA